MTSVEFSFSLMQVQDQLKRFAYTLTSNEEEAQDLLQDTNYKALKYRNKFSADTNLKAWLYTIMRNTFINDYRKVVKKRAYAEHLKHSLRELPESYKFPTPESTAGEQDIQQLIQALSEELRIPFERHLEGYKYKEISKELNLPMGTVKSRIFHARRILMEQLKN